MKPKNDGNMLFEGRKQSDVCHFLKGAHCGVYVLNH